ncbi:hypothetical protein [Deinococcus kurensis]|uniref:hypothetical protein n=1 Tax=Deinococcus kurensis TaxID=2662757 RepID=UPI0012D3470E|nr:hypothetical protein [Deinococcus kurensis]
MKPILLPLLFAVATASASAQTCAAKVTGTAKLKDAHHVAYSVTVSNPTARPLEVSLRVDFFFKGKKLDGGFETLRATLPANGKKVFTGTEAFLDVLKGADQVKVTKIRTCK